MNSSSDEHNRGGMIAFIGSIVFCVLFFIYIAFIHPGIDLKEVTEAAEASVPAVSEEVQKSVVDVKKIEKPWLENADIAAYGKKVYANNCAICHGSEGKGDGPAGAALKPPPRNFVDGKWSNGGDSIALFTTIENGLEGSSMASFKHLPKLDRWALVQFIRSITQHKVLDTETKLNDFGSTAQ